MLALMSNSKVLYGIASLCHVDVTQHSTRIHWCCFQCRVALQMAGGIGSNARPWKTDAHNMVHNVDQAQIEV